MNNTPPKYNEEIDWKKYLEKSLQEQIKTTDAIRNLPYELEIKNITDDIRKSNKNVYESINCNIGETVSESIEKSNKELAKRFTKKQITQKNISEPIKKPDNNNLKKLDSNEITQPMIQSNKKMFEKMTESSKEITIKTAEVIGENLKEGYREIGGVVSGHINDVIGPNIQRAYAETKIIGTYLIKNFGKFFSIFKMFGKKDKEEEEMYSNINKFTDAATKKGSIYTHDITTEEYLKENNKYFKREEKRRLREIKEKDDKNSFWKTLITATLLFFGFLYGRVKYFGKIVDKFVLKPLKLVSSKIWTKITSTFKESKIGKSLISLSKWFKNLSLNILKTLKKTKIGKMFFNAIEKLWKTIGKMWSMIIKSKIFRFYEWFKSIGTKIESVPISSMKKFPGIIGTIKDFINTMFSSLKGVSKLKKISLIIGKFMVRLKFIPFFIGEMIGRIFIPIEMIYKIIKGMFTEGTIRDKILAMSSGILSAVLHIPEMIGNAILWLIRKIFGKNIFKNFKFDFSMEKIIDAVNDITKWVGGFFDIIFNLFNKTLPNIFNNISNWFNKKIDKIKFYSNPFNWNKSYEKENQQNKIDEKTGKLLHNVGESQEEYQKRLMEWRKSIKPANYKISGTMMEYQEKQIEAKKEAYNNKQNQIKKQQKTQEEMLKTNKELSQQNQGITQTIINTTNMMSQNKNESKEIPNQNENAILSLVSTGALM